MVAGSGIEPSATVGRWVEVRTQSARLHGPARLLTGLCVVLCVACTRTKTASDGDAAGTGDVTCVPVDRPPTPPQPDPWVQVDGSQSGTCVRSRGGRLFCWGSSLNEQTARRSGTPASPVPFEVVLPRAAIRLALSGGGGCVETHGGAPICWGQRLRTLPHRAINTTPLFELDDLAGAVTFDCGDVTACALTGSSQIGCWTTPQDDARRVHHQSAMVRSAALSSLRVGFDVGCALEQSGALRCWSVDRRPVADGLDTELHPTLVTLPGPVNAVGVGGLNAAIVRGEVYQFSMPLNRERGAPSSEPVVGYRVDGIPPMLDLSAGLDFLCGRTTSGEVYCWGSSQYGELGQYRADRSAVRVPLPREAHAIGSGTFHSCAILVDNSVWCWGLNATNQLGASDTNTIGPVRVEHLESLRQSSSARMEESTPCV